MPGGPRVDSDDGEGDWSSEPSDDERLEVLSNSSSEAEDDSGKPTYLTLKEMTLSVSAAQQGRAARSNLATTKKDLLYGTSSI